MVTTCGTSTRRLSDLGLSTPCWLAVADVLVGLAANCSLCLPVVGLVCPALCSHEVDQLFKRHGRNLSIRLQVTFWTAEDVDLYRDPHDWQEFVTTPIHTVFLSLMFAGHFLDGGGCGPVPRPPRLAGAGDGRKVVCVVRAGLPGGLGCVLVALC